MFNFARKSCRKISYWCQWIWGNKLLYRTAVQCGCVGVLVGVGVCVATCPCTCKWHIAAKGIRTLFPLSKMFCWLYHRWAKLTWCALRASCTVSQLLNALVTHVKSRSWCIYCFCGCCCCLVYAKPRCRTTEIFCVNMNHIVTSAGSPTVLRYVVCWGYSTS